MNIHKLAYIYFSLGYEADLRRMTKVDRFFAKSYILGFVYFFLRFFNSFFSYGLRLPKQISKAPFLFIGLTNNNRTTLKPLITTFKKRGNDVIELTNKNEFPMWKLYLYSIVYFPKLIKAIKSSNKEEKLVIKSRFAIMWRTYGGPKLAKEIIRKYKPQTIIVASDQDPFYRAIIEYAKTLNINTVYVQHAAVTNKFPPLDFTFSFLDGKESLSKYKQAGKPNGNIVLCGGVRFDIATAYKKKTEKNIIGVAINTIDDADCVISLCMFLKSKGFRIVFRPHPTMKVTEWAAWCIKNNIEFSDPKNENSFQFLSRLTYLIANQSSIHLDAAILGIDSTLFNFSKTIQNDYYGFLATGLINESKAYEDILTLLNAPKVQKRDSIRYYNSSSLTPFMGSVSTLIYEILTEQNKRIDSKGIFKEIEVNDGYIVYDYI